MRRLQNKILLALLQLNIQLVKEKLFRGNKWNQDRHITIPSCHSLILAANIKIQYACCLYQRKNLAAIRLFTTQPAKKRQWEKPPDSGSLGSEVDGDVSERKYKLDWGGGRREKKEMKMKREQFNHLITLQTTKNRKLDDVIIGETKLAGLRDWQYNTIFTVLM